VAVSGGIRLVPDRAGYAPGADVVIEVTGSRGEGGELVVTHFADEVRRVAVEPGATRIAIGAYERGGYGVRLGDAATAFDVLEDPFERPRYGFVVHLTDPDRIEVVGGAFRRLHLTAAQFYDWAYRHAQLLPPERRYVDPLGQERDLEVVDRMSLALEAAGTVPLGYSAVYAFASSELEHWSDSVLLRTDGEPYRLGDDFLVLVDPAEPRWLEHYLGQLEEVMRGTALRGFHLDQYGWPKFARRADGTRVDLAASFRTLLEAVRERVPSARFMFNNVNDFGTAETATAPQDATYIEVWPPHSTLQDLAGLAAAARSRRPEHPPILSAYLSCFAAGEERAVSAAELVMATVFSSGAAHLLLGEAGAALTDPYYARHHELSPEALEAFVPWYDFAVRYGDLLYDPTAVDVSESFAGGINQDVVVTAPGIRSSTKAEAGTLWTRVVRTREGLVVHLIDLGAQHETEWDAGKEASPVRSGVRLSLAPVAPGATVRFATVDAPDLVALGASGAGTSKQVDALSAAQATTWFEVPPFRAWALVHIPFDALG